MIFFLFFDDNFEGVPTTSKNSSHFGAQRDVFINNESKQQFISVRIVPPRDGQVIHLEWMKYQFGVCEPGSDVGGKARFP